MPRQPLEGQAWELYYQVQKELSEDLMDELDNEEADIVRRYFGIFPYQGHSYSMLALALKVNKGKAYRTIRVIMNKLKKKALERLQGERTKRR